MTTKFKIGDAIMVMISNLGYDGMIGNLERVNGRDADNRRHFWTNIPLLPEHSNFDNIDSRGMKSVCTSDIILLKDCSPCQIAQAIRANWKNPYFGAEPYMAALWNLTDWNSNYGADSASSVIRYFLSNAQTWKGQSARLIKKCLNDKLH